VTKSPRIAFIKAGWHAEIVDRALDGFLAELNTTYPDAKVDVLDVPGAYEMPLLAQTLAMTGRYDVIAAAAFIVDGGIYRHEFVAQAVVSGLMDVQLKTGVPVLSISLTPHAFQESETHFGLFKDHFVRKGGEAARAAVSVFRLYAGLAPSRVAAA